MYDFEPPAPERLFSRAERRDFMPTVRGVVLAVHYADEQPVDRHRPGALTVDVLTLFGDPLSRVPLLYHGLGVRSGARWHPRPATETLDGQPLSWEEVDGAVPVDPEQIDGEWVLVGFIGGSSGAPIVLGSIDSPRASRTHTAGPGVAPDPAADETLGEEVKGWTRNVAHRGTIAAIDDAGNVVIDTTRAGTSEASPDTQDDSGGLIDVNARAGQPIIIRQGGVRRVRVTVDDAGVPQVDLLDGNRPLARLSDVVAINAASSPGLAAHLKATTEALVALAAWAAAEDGPVFEPPVVPTDVVPGAPDEPPALAVGIIATGSEQIRGT